MNKICKQCQTQFDVTEEDLQFYDKVSPVFAGKKYEVPLPTLCPPCRQQRRLAWRNERKLYNRKCDLTGKQIISVFSPDKPFKVYDKDAWWSDSWDELSYGREVDFNRPFLDQLKELMLDVPRMALWNIDPVNSDYNQSTGWLKNCYLLAAANRNEDCYYGNYVNDCKNCVDNLMIKNCELCYECIECEGSYECFFCKNCVNCTSSQFLFNCISCTNCFGCVNLQRKEYCFFNEQLSKEEYQIKIKEINTKSYLHLEKLAALMKETVLKYPVKYMIGTHNEDVTGNGIYQSHHAYACFDVSKLENCSHFSWFHEAKDCMDTFAWGMSAELCYDSMEIGGGAYRTLFCATSQGTKNAFYSYQCMFSENIFGCVGLKRKKHCILNKQYTQAEYEQLLPKIIEHMKKGNEWGEFFPYSLSPFCYNETVASEFFPLSPDQAVSLGSAWREEDDQNKYQGPRSDLHDTIDDVSDDVLKSILTCAKCQKNYKVISQELQFHRDHSVALSQFCPACRHQKRIEQRNPRKLWDRHCAKCTTAISTSYSPDRPETVYCEKCYLETVY